MILDPPHFQDFRNTSIVILDYRGSHMFWAAQKLIYQRVCKNESFTTVKQIIYCKYIFILRYSMHTQTNLKQRYRSKCFTSHIPIFSSNLDNLPFLSQMTYERVIHLKRKPKMYSQTCNSIQRFLLRYILCNSFICHLAQKWQVV